MNVQQPVTAAMEITIKSLKDRKTFQVALNTDDTLDELRAAIEKAQDVPANSQKLVFGGKTLREGPTLRELGVQKGATLHLVLRLKTSVEARTTPRALLVSSSDGRARARATHLF